MNIISIIVRSKFLLLKFLLTNKRISSHKNGIFSKIINLKIYIFTEELSLAFKRKGRSFRGNSEEILQNFSSTNISSNCPRIYLISWTVIALFHIQKSGHLEDEFTKFSVTSGHVSRGKGNGWKSRVDRELYLRCSRERSSYRLDERSRGEIINGARASILPLSGAKMPW